MVMMIYVVNLLFICGRAWIALDDVPAMQVNETVKQQFTKHFTVLLAFLALLLSLVMQLCGLGTQAIQ